MISYEMSTPMTEQSVVNLSATWKLCRQVLVTGQKSLVMGTMDPVHAVVSGRVTFVVWVRVIGKSGEVVRIHSRQGT